MPKSPKKDDPQEEPESNEFEDQTEYEAEVERVNDDVTELAQQVGELTAALQRERADAVNLRRRHDDQVASLRNVVRAGIIREFLPVIDNLERALKVVPDDLKDNDYVTGIQGVVRQFEKALSNIGVERIKTVGEPFDPSLHEAVSMDEASEGTKEIVSEELQAGYLLGNEVIRHAMVRVALG
jgi:molecular chaperone GrpE